MAWRITRREFARDSAGLMAMGLAATAAAGDAEAQPACTLQTRYVTYSIGTDGRNLRFVDRTTGQDYSLPDAANVVATVKQDGAYHPVTAVSFVDDRLSMQFAAAQVRAVVKAIAQPDHIVLEVVSVEGESVEEFVFADVRLTLTGALGEPLSACALALNLQTNVHELPRATNRLRALCYPRFGFVGAKVALLACPEENLRDVMQRVVSSAPDLPHSAIGGPWAWGKPVNQGSYLFNFSGLSEGTVDAWINLAASLGVNQIDFHGGSSFRFGDCRPDPATYPDGLQSLKRVIDRLHAAGIYAGLHTYAFFIDRNCPWVTPVPDKRLAADSTFTLAETLDAESDSVPVVESTQNMSTVTGFFVRNSVTLRIDDELIVYSGLSTAPPYAYTKCQRGAWGTRAAEHARGAKVSHLKECFGLFVPDPESTLLPEVAGKTAEAFNVCGFDMIYLDALDGEDVLGGPQHGWHYGSKFVFELCRLLDKPAVMEMSTFHHHLWYVRSRMGAWDHPTRSHKAFIDMHCQANEENARMFLPSQLGWWAFKTWSGPQGEPTFTDDIEYLMGKCLGHDTGFALMGIDPDSAVTVPALPRLGDIIKRYEDLRHAGSVPEAMKEKLRVPGDESTLVGNVRDGWRFERVDYSKHKISGGSHPQQVWNVTNRFEAQPLRLRIEALMSAGPYDAADNPVLGNPAGEGEFPAMAGQGGVAVKLEPSEAKTPAGDPSGRLSASNQSPASRGAWAKCEKLFSPPRNLEQRQALGVWVQGDGQGETLNVQLRSPSHVSHAIGDHYIVIDFTGWRYFELIEPEGEAYARYRWPYGGSYSIYRERVEYSQLETLGLWYNEIPVQKETACCIGPIKALPLVPTTLVKPTINVGGQSVVFDVEIETGCYLEFQSSDDCRLYGQQGEFIRNVSVQGTIPLLAAGENELAFRVQTPPLVSPRARITVISRSRES